MNMNDKKIGNVLYSVDKKYNTFGNAKIKTVIDGVEWFRYEKPRIEYFVKSYVIVGKITHILEGEIENPEEYSDMFVLENCETKETFETLNTLYEENEKWFDNYEEASEYLIEMQRKTDD